MLDFMHSITSKFHDIELIQYGVVEPHNGRMLWEVDLKINGQLVTENYFGGWKYTDMAEPYEPDSPDGRYFFVPAEGGGFVLDTQQNFKSTGIRCKGPSAATFKGNLYFNNLLILVHRNEVILFDLPTQTQTSLNFPACSVLWVKPLIESQVEVIYTTSTLTNKTSMLVVI